MDLGAQRREIIAHLSDLIARMEEAMDRSTLARTVALDQTQRERAVGQVLDAIANVHDRHRAFEPDYFDTRPGFIVIEMQRPGSGGLFADDPRNLFVAGQVVCLREKSSA